MPELKQGDLVAVYGSLRKGLGNHQVLGNSQHIGNTRLSGFYMHSFGAYPYITHGSGTITAEVYAVESEQVAQSLDWLEGYPEFYDREQVQTEYGMAWVYFIDNENNNMHPLVPDGDWVAFKEDNPIPF